ncbi:hypothetical protein LTR05_008221 [Lithohypha guttulata]|uniref:Uncharacterized protein n=1 Tax=Lithohypha guttulata TaxID=1690604 RepID=A0AAN7STA5_9EURO|nr:hypothetical protein LTR05_008221 [Lithohypha guttulata]
MTSTPLAGSATNISGDARAQLGDRYTIQNVNIFTYGYDQFAGLHRPEERTLDHSAADVREELRGLRCRVQVEQHPRESNNLTTAHAAPTLVYPVTPNAMLEQTDYLAKKAFLEGADEALCEQFTQWWAYDNLTFMCAATSWDDDDEKSVLACADFYYHALGPKLIYISNASSRIDGENIVANMMDSLIQQQTHYLQSINFEMTSPRNMPPANDTDLTSKLETFKKRAMLGLSSGKDILLIVEGVATVARSNLETARLCKLFIQSLRAINAETSGSRIRCLFVGPGCGKLFSGHDKDVRFCEEGEQ